MDSTPIAAFNDSRANVPVLRRVHALAAAGSDTKADEREMLGISERPTLPRHFSQHARRSERGPADLPPIALGSLRAERRKVVTLFARGVLSPDAHRGGEEVQVTHVDRGGKGRRRSQRDLAEELPRAMLVDRVQSAPQGGVVESARTDLLAEKRLRID